MKVEGKRVDKGSGEILVFSNPSLPIMFLEINFAVDDSSYF